MFSFYISMKHKSFKVRPRLVNSLVIVILFIETEMRDAVIINY